MHLALRYVVLVCHQYDVCKNSFGSVYVGGHGGLSESGLCVFILPFGMLCLSAISMMFVKIILAVCMLVGMVV